ncbi:hypothetical protein COE51_01450 [Bacillus pseudomycoides]|nr:hypothetical protein COE51_01450 [Bacillus pseudomycoides]
MSSYKYQNPTERGYIKFKLTKKQHNKIFGYRKMRWLDRYEYYYNEDTVILHRFVNWKGILFCTLLFPVTIFMVGLSNFIEVWSDMLSLYKQKETGSFISDHVWKNEKKFNQIMDVVRQDKWKK